MTLEKAIELPELYLREAGKKMPLDVRAAVTLLIEATKQLMAIRQAHPEFKTFELPSETQD
ncbi:hypothetical protein ES703_00376 [subsurface metagenome]